jgi:hypothetical protein
MERLRRGTVEMEASEHTRKLIITHKPGGPMVDDQKSYAN